MGIGLRGGVGGFSRWNCCIAWSTRLYGSTWLPRTTRRYDRDRHWLDRHASYALTAWLDGAIVTTARPDQE